MTHDPHAVLVLSAAADYCDGKAPSPTTISKLPTGAILECWLVAELTDLVPHPRWGSSAKRIWDRVMAKWMDSTPEAPAWRSW
jgi:hypothetical protein